MVHVLLDEGHLWGEKQVAIPISAVTESNTLCASTSQRTRCATCRQSSSSNPEGHMNSGQFCCG